MQFNGNKPSGGDKLEQKEKILTDRQAVETIGEYFPQFDVISSLAFIIKSINSERKI